MMIEHMWIRPLIVGVAVAIAMTGLWVFQRRTRDATIVDLGWTVGIGAAAIFYAVVGEGDIGRRVLLAALVGGWSARLARHILFDRVLKGVEDGRYKALREEWGDRFDGRMFWFFHAQGLLVVILSIPFLLASEDKRAGLQLTDILAAALWIVGMAGETIADKQLAAWRSNPENKGKTCRAGLWRYSRHPNYFFEWLMWCAFALLALPAPMGWLGLSAPLLMLLLITKVTGIPPSEAQAVRSRGDDYRRYQKSTSAFFPWPPNIDAEKPEDRST